MIHISSHVYSPRSSACRIMIELKTLPVIHRLFHLMQRLKGGSHRAALSSSQKSHGGNFDITHGDFLFSHLLMEQRVWPGGWEHATEVSLQQPNLNREFLAEKQGNATLPSTRLTEDWCRAGYFSTKVSQSDPTSQVPIVDYPWRP